jgi:hypothetical protein
LDVALVVLGEAARLKPFFYVDAFALLLNDHRRRLSPRVIAPVRWLRTLIRAYPLPGWCRNHPSPAIRNSEEALSQ